MTELLPAALSASVLLPGGSPTHHPEHRRPLGTTPFCFHKNNQKHLRVFPFSVHIGTPNRNQHKSLFF